MTKRNNETVLVLDEGGMFLKIGLFSLNRKEGTYNLMNIKVLENEDFSIKLINKQLRNFLAETGTKDVEIIIRLINKRAQSQMTYSTVENWDNKSLIRKEELKRMKQTSKTKRVKVVFDETDTTRNHVDLCSYVYEQNMSTVNELLNGIKYRYLHILEPKHILIEQLINKSFNSLVIDIGHTGTDILVGKNGFLKHYKYLEFAGKMVMEELKNILEINDVNELKIKRNDVSLSDLVTTTDKKGFTVLFQASMQQFLLSEKIEDFNLYVIGGNSDLHQEELFSRQIKRADLKLPSSLVNASVIPNEIVELAYTNLVSIDYLLNSKRVLDINNTLLAYLSKYDKLVNTVACSLLAVSLSMMSTGFILNEKVDSKLSSVLTQASMYSVQKIDELDTNISNTEHEIMNTINEIEKDNSNFTLSQLILAIEEIKPDSVFINEIIYNDYKFTINISSLNTMDIKIFYDKLLSTKVFSEIKTVNLGIENLNGVYIQNILFIGR